MKAKRVTGSAVCMKYYIIIYKLSTGKALVSTIKLHLHNKTQNAFTNFRTSGAGSLARTNKP